MRYPNFEKMIFFGSKSVNVDEIDQTKSDNADEIDPTKSDNIDEIFDTQGSSHESSRLQSPARSRRKPKMSIIKKILFLCFLMMLFISLGFLLSMIPNIKVWTGQCKSDEIKMNLACAPKSDESNITDFCKAIGECFNNNISAANCAINSHNNLTRDIVFCDNYRVVEQEIIISFSRQTEIIITLIIIGVLTIFHGNVMSKVKLHLSQLF